MIFHLFRLATLAKGALALSLVTGAYGAGNADVQEYRSRTTSVHVEATLEPTASAQPTARPEPKKDTAETKKATDERKKTESSTKLESPAPSFDELLKECVARYSRAVENTKQACERAIAASGLGADAFWTNYRSLLVPPATKTEKPATATSFEALLSECVARYRRGADNTKEACDRAIGASGLTTEAFLAKYRSLLVPSAAKPRTTEPQKPVTTPASSPKPASTDPAVTECLAKYETLRTQKTGPAEAFEAALRTFNETCRSVLEASR